MPQCLDHLLVTYNMIYCVFSVFLAHFYFLFIILQRHIFLFTILLLQNVEMTKGSFFSFQEMLIMIIFFRMSDILGLMRIRYDRSAIVCVPPQFAMCGYRIPKIHNHFISVEVNKTTTKNCGNKYALLHVAAAAACMSTLMIIKIMKK